MTEQTNFQRELPLKITTDGTHCSPDCMFLEQYEYPNKTVGQCILFNQILKNNSKDPAERKWAVAGKCQRLFFNEPHL